MLMLFPLVLGIFSIGIHAHDQRVHEEVAIYPGTARIPLELLYAYPLAASIQVGFNQSNIFLSMLSTRSDVVIGPFGNGPLYNVSDSVSYVSTNTSCQVKLVSPQYQQFPATGIRSFEYFRLADLILQGQSFLYSTEELGIFDVQSLMGFGLNGCHHRHHHHRNSKCRDETNFVENLFDQAQLNQTVISFYSNFSYYNGGASDAGFMYLGAIEEEFMGGPPVNYTTIECSQGWTFSLENLIINNTSLGANGKIVIATANAFGSMPLPFFQAMISLLDMIPGLVTDSLGDYHLAVYPCSLAPDYMDLFPNITFHVDGKPLVLTPDQYIAPFPGDSCYLTFYGFEPSHSIYGNSFTIGTAMLNQTYSYFDLETGVFGRAPRALSIPPPPPPLCKGRSVC